MTSPDAAEADDWMADYTPSYLASCYLGGLASAFADGTRPELDPTLCHAEQFPAEFARLRGQWTKCLDAAAIINSRYQDDWNRAGGPLTVIAPAVRECALDALAEVWEALVQNYIGETLDADRAPWDCPFCGVQVPRDTRFDHRCPSCMCVLNPNTAGTGWE